MDTKHSPTPWTHGWGDGITGPEAAATLEWDGKYPIRCASPFGGDRRLVAAIPTFPGHNHEADAALIVHAVNSHAELVDQVAELLAALERRGPCEPDSIEQTIRDDARALLSKES